MNSIQDLKQQPASTKKTFQQNEQQMSFKQHITKQTLYISSLANEIPKILTYPLLIGFFLINLLQLNKIQIINPYTLSMDPYYIIDKHPQQYWRLISYIIAIDGSDAGIKDIILNIPMLIAIGLMANHIKVLKEKEKLQSIKKYINTPSLQPQINDLTHSYSYVDQTPIHLEIQRPIKIKTNDIQKKKTKKDIHKDIKHNNSYYKYWLKLLLIEIPFITLILSLINCTLWYAITRNGPHTYVSMGILPLFYYFIMKISFLERQKYNFSLLFIPFKMKNKYQGYLIGILFIIFSNEAQACFIVMIICSILCCITK